MELHTYRRRDVGRFVQPATSLDVVTDRSPTHSRPLTDVTLQVGCPLHVNELLETREQIIVLRMSPMSNSQVGAATTPEAGNS